MGLHDQYTDKLRVAWHEAGHAVWGMSNGKRTSLTHCVADGVAGCIAEPPEIKGTMPHIEFLLSGLAGEKVYCSKTNSEFFLEEREFFMSIMEVWYLQDPSGYLSKELQLYNSTFDQFCKHAPPEARKLAEEVFDRLYENLLQEPRLEAIADRFVVGDISEDELCLLWNSPANGQEER